MTTATETTRKGRHPCPADSCGELIARHLFACSRHWYALPADLRSKVRTAWHRIRTEPLHYLEVREEAINFLNGTHPRTDTTVDEVIIRIKPSDAFRLADFIRAHADET